MNWQNLDSELRGTDADPQDIANERNLVIIEDDDAANTGGCWWGTAAPVAEALADYRESGGTVSRYWAPA